MYVNVPNKLFRLVKGPQVEIQASPTKITNYQT